MKKALLASSALIAAGFATSAAAAEWETSVGGYMHVGAAMSDSDGQDGVGILRDGEIHLGARLVADNGITFRARVELEAWTQAGDQIDENWVSVSGSFGELMIGGNDDAAYTMGEDAFFGAGGHFGYVDQFGITRASTQSAWVTGFSRDSVGIHYYTPSFYGFMLGATYIPSLSADGLGDSNNFVYDGGDEAWAFAAQYKGDFGDFGFGITGWYADIEGVSGEQIGVSGDVSFSGFTVAGIYQDSFNGDDYAIGMQYKTGPWTFAGGYSDSNNTGGDVLTGWIGYALAPGVTLTGGLEYAEAGAAPGTGGSYDDFGGAVTLSLSF